MVGYGKGVAYTVHNTVRISWLSAKGHSTQRWPLGQCSCTVHPVTAVHIDDITSE